MSELHPTPSRLALLRDVEAGHVWSTAGAAYNGASGQTRRVNDTIRSMRYAGWVEEHCGVWCLTNKGREVLESRAGSSRLTSGDTPT